MRSFRMKIRYQGFTKDIRVDVYGTSDYVLVDILTTIGKIIILISM